MPSNNLPKVGIALSGGAALGATHIGALESLKKHRIPIDMLAGTSAGAMVASLYAFGVPLEVMKKEAANLSWRNVSKFSISKLGLVSNQALETMIIRLVGKKNIEDAYLPLAIVATDIRTGERVVMREGDLATAIMASTCIPGIFQPVNRKGHLLVDGGLVENIPLDAVRELGAEIIIGVNLLRHRTFRTPNNVMDVMINSLDIINHTSKHSREQVADILIEPDLANFNQSDFKKSKVLFDRGTKATEAKIKEIQKMIKSNVHPSMWERIKELLSWTDYSDEANNK